jgi:hypothetical protein
LRRVAINFLFNLLLINDELKNELNKYLAYMRQKCFLMLRPKQVTKKVERFDRPGIKWMLVVVVFSPYRILIRVEKLIIAVGWGFYAIIHPNNTTTGLLFGWQN